MTPEVRAWLLIVAVCAILWIWLGIELNSFLQERKLKKLESQEHQYELKKVIEMEKENNNNIEIQEILVKLVENELCLYIDNDDNRIYCNYNTYKINERNPISETEYNKVIEFLKRKRDKLR